MIFWNGTATSHPFSLGLDNSTLWFSVPSDNLHRFYVWGLPMVSVNIKGLAIGGDTAFLLSMYHLVNVDIKISTREIHDNKHEGFEY